MVLLGEGAVSYERGNPEQSALAVLMEIFTLVVPAARLMGAHSALGSSQSSTSPAVGLRKTYAQERKLTPSLRTRSSTTTAEA